MSQKTEAQSYPEGHAGAGGETETFGEKLKRVAGRVALVGAVSTAAVLGIGKSPETTDSSELGSKAAQTTGETVTNGAKGAAPDIEDELNAAVQEVHDDYLNSEAFNKGGGIPNLRDKEEPGNPEENQPEDSFPENNAPGESVDPATKETGIYEESEAFPGNDGRSAVEAEQEAEQNAQPEIESQIGDAISAVRGENGEEIYVDPATGEQVPPPESAQEQP